MHKSKLLPTYKPRPSYMLLNICKPTYRPCRYFWVRVCDALCLRVQHGWDQPIALQYKPENKPRTSRVGGDRQYFLFCLWLWQPNLYESLYAPVPKNLCGEHSNVKI